MPRPLITTDSSVSLSAAALTVTCPASPLAVVVNPWRRSRRSYSASVVVMSRRGTSGSGTSTSVRDVMRRPSGRVSVVTE